MYLSFSVSDMLWQFGVSIKMSIRLFLIFTYKGQWKSTCISSSTMFLQWKHVRLPNSIFSYRPVSNLSGATPHRNLANASKLDVFGTLVLNLGWLYRLFCWVSDKQPTNNYFFSIFRRNRKHPQFRESTFWRKRLQIWKKRNWRF